MEETIFTPTEDEVNFLLDVRAVSVASAVAACVYVSITSPMGTKALPRVVGSPSNSFAAAQWDGAKRRKFAKNLPAEAPPPTFSPVVWGAFGRFGPPRPIFWRRLWAAHPADRP